MTYHRRASGSTNREIGSRAVCSAELLFLLCKLWGKPVAPRAQMDSGWSSGVRVCESNDVRSIVHPDPTANWRMAMMDGMPCFSSYEQWHGVVLSYYYLVDIKLPETSDG